MSLEHACIYSMYVRSRPLTRGWVQKACPQAEEEEMVVEVEGRCYVDCSLLAGNIHQPDRTEQHVSITQPRRTVTASCAMCEGMQPQVKPNADSSFLSATQVLTIPISLFF